MKKNSGEKNEREEEFPNGRESEKRKKEKNTHTQQRPNEEQCTEHITQRLGKKIFVMAICFFTHSIEAGKGENIYKGIYG